MIYDVIIIGGGPVGVAAGVYTARKKLKTLLITDSFGGQSLVSAGIENWIGEEEISGFDLAQKFEKHVRKYSEDIDFEVPQKVAKIEAIDCEVEDRNCDFQVTTEKGDKFVGKTVILGAGAHRRKLNVPGEKEFDGKGVVYCSTCDAPLFKDKEVIIVGSGNAALEGVEDSIPYAKMIHLFVRSDKMKGDPVTQEKITDHPKVKIYYKTEIKEIVGDKFVTGVKYKDSEGEKEMEIGGVFVEIGAVPNSDIVKGLVYLDKFGQVKIDSKFATTSHPGIFAAGDITDDPFKQNNISAGDAVKAALSAYQYLLKREKKSPAEEGKEQ